MVSLIYYWRVYTFSKKWIWLLGDWQWAKGQCRLKGLKNWEKKKIAHVMWFSDALKNLKEFLFSLKCCYFSPLLYTFECIFITEKGFIKLWLLYLMLSDLKSLCPRWEGHVWVWLNLNTLNTKRGAWIEKKKQDRIMGLNSVPGIAYAIPTTSIDVLYWTVGLG